MMVSTMGSVMVLKGLIFTNFHFGRVWCLERTDFHQSPLWEDIGVSKALVFSDTI